MKEKFEITLIKNGIHSFNKGLDKFLDYQSNNKKDEFQLKEAIMFLHHGTELLLKQVLINEKGEYLIFSDINSDTTKKIIRAKEQGISVFNLTKPPKTASFLEIIDRIKAFVNTPKIDESLESRLKELNSFRNNLEHYGIYCDKLRVENLLLKLHKPISEFFRTSGIDLSEINENKWKQIEEKLLLEASRLRAGGSIKKAELVDNKAIIEYVKDYNEYKKNQPQSSLTKEQFYGYWDSEDTVLKALNDGGVRLMRKLDILDKVEISLPFNGFRYYLKIDRKAIEKYLGYSFEQIDKDWDNTFSNKFVYDSKGRRKFFKRFGKKIKNN
jgi:hypothetical protein